MANRDIRAERERPLLSSHDVAILLLISVGVGFALSLDKLPYKIAEATVDIMMGALFTVIVAPLVISACRGIYRWRRFVHRVGRHVGANIFPLYCLPGRHKGMLELTFFASRAIVRVSRWPCIGVKVGPFMAWRTIVVLPATNESRLRQRLGRFSRDTLGG